MGGRPGEETRRGVCAFGPLQTGCRADGLPAILARMAPRYLYPLAQHPDAPHLLVPSRLFPWVGFGWALGAFLVLPVLALLAIMGGQGSRSQGGAAVSTAALGIVVGIEALMLAWGAVHAVRLVGLHRRLTASLDRIVAPPAHYLEQVRRADADFARRDERAGAIRLLVVCQAWAGRLVDLFARGGPDSDGPYDAHGRVFRAAQAPRTAFLTSAIWLSAWWLLLFGFTAVGSPGGLPALPALGFAHFAVSGLLLAELWIIAGVRFSLDRGIRARLRRLELQRF